MNSKAANSKYYLIRKLEIFQNQQTDFQNFDGNKN